MSALTPPTIIFADASFSQERDGIGGWGAWIRRGDLPPVTKGGTLLAPIKSSTEAEMRALANALRVAEKWGLVAPRETVILQSDSRNALGWILCACPLSEDDPHLHGLSVPRPQKLASAAKDSHGLAIFREDAARLELNIVTRHVDAHRGEMTTRHAINSECDRIAREYLRQAREAKGVS